MNDLKRRGYCIQCCLFNKLLKEAHIKSGSELSILAWLDEKNSFSEMCYYWKMILNLELEIKIFVHTGDFKLYVENLNKFLWWYFALEISSIILDGPLFIGLICCAFLTPALQFTTSSGREFSFLKTKTPFSWMGLDQLHEQNNKVLTGMCGNKPFQRR